MKPSPHRHSIAKALASAFSLALLLAALLIVALSSSATGATGPAAHLAAVGSQAVAAGQSRTAVAPAPAGSPLRAVDLSANHGSAAEAVRRAWDLARRVGAYTFGTDLVETAYPALLLTNAGRGPQQTQLHLEGAVDLPGQKIEMRMWQGAGSVMNDSTGSEARYEGGHAYVRAPSGAWKEVEDFSAGFAPGADPLAFLAGMKNTRVAPGAEGAYGVGVSHYAFDLDGRALANHVRDELEQQLRERGELPLNLTLDVSTEFRDARGYGELWVDSRGLPLRLALHLAFPEHPDGSHVEAAVQTDFSGFPEQLARAPALAEDPAAWVAATLDTLGLGRDAFATPAAAATTAGPSGALAIGALAIAFLIGCRRSRKLYAVVVVAVVLSMVLVPLMQSERASAYFEKQETTTSNSEQQAAQDTLQNQLTPAWDSHQDPLAASESQETNPTTMTPARDASLVPGLLTQDVGSTADSGCDQSKTDDTDKDGLNAYEECLFGTIQDENDPAKNPDSDGDGLNDGQEVNRLGTDPNAADTDGDQLSDAVEVAGFNYQGQMWYLDPKNPDTNNDGVVDTMECMGFAAGETVGQNCDTDLDNIPNFFDFDNDNDGVPDRVDLSTDTRLDRSGLGIGQSADGGVFDGTHSFLFVVSDLQPNWPVLVDFQVRPANPDHLSYALNVLDWPSNDYDGQIQHVKPTTFATSDNPDIKNPDDAAGSHGDMRLVPLLEITIPGTQVPLKLTDPAVTATLEGSLAGTVAFTQQAANHNNTGMKFTFDQAGSHDVKLYKGACPVSGTPLQAYPAQTSGGEQTYTGMKLNDLADGKHAVTFTQGSTSTCATIPNMITGPYTEQMIDQSVFQPYGISVQETDAKQIQLLVPVSVVSDDTGGGKTAFQARMIYWPGSTNVWQEAQEIRLVWLVNMITDECDQSGFSTWDQWHKDHPDGTEEDYDAALSVYCESHRTMDQIQPVQTYADKWFITGLNVREDHGLDVAVAYPNPSGLTKATYDAPGGRFDALWGLSYGLGQQFVTGRTCETASTINNDTEPGSCTDATRDISVFLKDKSETITFGNSTISQRFDVASTVSGNSLWNIPAGTLEVKDYRYPNQDYLSYLSANVTPKILEKYTDTTVTPTILFAREERFRSASLDALTQDTGTVTLSLNGFPEQTMAGVNWEPFHYAGTAWESYSFSDYWPFLADNLRQRFWAEYGTETEDAIEGRVAIARAYYMGLVNGVTQGLDLPSAHAAGYSDSQLASGFTTLASASAASPASAFGSWLSKTADDILFNLVNAMRYNREGNTYMGYGIYVDAAGNYLVPPGKIYGKIGSALNWTKGKITSGVYAAYDATIGVWRSLMHVPTTYKMASVAAIGVALISIGVCMIVGATTDADMISIAKSSLGVLLNVHFVVGAIVSTAKEAWKAGKTFAQLISGNLLGIGKSQFWKTMGENKGGVVAAILSVGAAWASFAMTWALGGIPAGSMAWDSALAGAIAGTIATILLFVIFNALGPLGQLIKAIVGLIDALVGMICNTFLSEEQRASEAAEWLCGGLTGLVTNLVEWLIYSGELIVDLEPDEDKGPPWYPRLQLGNLTTSLARPEDGIVVGNKMTFGINITNTIDLAPIPASPFEAWYWWQFNDDNLARSTFDYRWQPSENDFHGGLSLGGLTWSKTNNKLPLVYKENVTAGQAFEFNTAGINQPVKPLYLSEAYAVPEQECWGLLGIGGCGISTEKATAHYDFGESLVFDVLPAHLDGFYAKEKIGGKWRLSWDQSTEGANFPALYDADGDDLPADVDPNDSLWDTDGDGLSDYFEQSTGSDPTKVDTDSDGLSDYEEARYDTNPRLKDSDGDGLADAVEVFHQDLMDRDSDGVKTEWLGGWDFAYGRKADDTPLITRVYSDPNSVDADGDTVGDNLEHVYGYNPNCPSIINVLNLESDIAEASGGQKIATDSYVRPGDTLYYTATVKNELDLRQAHGVLSTLSTPLLDATSIPQPQSFVLDALKSKTVQGTVKVSSVAASGVYSMTQVAGAQIRDWRTASSEASLWLRFDDSHDATTFMDTSGSQPRHDGSCVGTGCKTETGGRFGDAIRFTGSGYVHSDAEVAPAGAYAISLWFKADTAGQSAALFADRSGYTATRGEIFLLSGKVCSEIRNSNGAQQLCTDAAVSAQQWHHVVHTYGQAVAGQQLYLDGALVKSNSTAGLPTTITTRVNIGGSPAGEVANFVGLIDEVRLYSRALTAAEVSDLAQLPVFHMDFENASKWEDVSSWNAPISCTSPNCPTLVDGVNGKAARLNGSSFLNVGTGSSTSAELDLSGGEYSVAAWIYPETTDCFFNPKFAEQYIIGSDTTGYTYPTLYLKASGADFVIGSMFTATNLGMQWLLSDATIPAGQWSHVVLTYVTGGTGDGWSQGWVYVNGKEAWTSGVSTPGLKPYPTKYFQVGDSGVSGVVNSLCGKVDELLIYNRVLEPETVERLSADEASALHLPLDEPPGAAAFQDTSAARRQLACGGTDRCPASGLFGRVNQAVAFQSGKGETLVLDNGPVNRMVKNFSVAGWIRPGQVTGDQFVIAPATVATTNGWRFGLSGSELRLQAYVSNSWMNYTTSGAGLQANRWYHVAAVMDSSNAVSFYIDGAFKAKVASQQPSTALAPDQDDQLIIGAASSGSALLTYPYFGMVDDLWVYGMALSADQVAALHKSAPAMHVAFENSDGGSDLADRASYGSAGTCTANDACPKLGRAVRGQVGLAGEFDGVNDRVSVADRAGLSSKYFTVSAWVKPSAQPATTAPPWYTVVAKGGAGTLNYRLAVNKDLVPVVEVGCSSAPTSAQAQNPLMPEQWNHLMGTYDGKALRLYVNGQQAATTDTPVDVGCTNTSAVRIGGDDDPSYRYFAGRIDEVTMYNAAMPAYDILDLYNYQLGWVEDWQDRNMVVDNEPPAATVVITNAVHLANQPAVIAIDAQDATSGIASVNINDGDPAAQCADPAQGPAWCWWFTPGGEGAYSITAKATDLVGRTAYSAPKTVYVDATAPTLGLTQSGPVNAIRSTVEPDVWLLKFSGSVKDTPKIAGTASGIPADGVRVTVRDANGRALGGVGQVATISGEAWSLDYRVPKADPDGCYTVYVEAVDNIARIPNVGDTQIGLHTSKTSAAIQVDARAPQMRFDDYNSLPQGKLTTGLPALQGRISERSLPVHVQIKGLPQSPGSIYLQFRCSIGTGSELWLFKVNAGDLADGTIKSWDGEVQQGSDCRLYTNSHGTQSAVVSASVCGVAQTSMAYDATGSYYTLVMDGAACLPKTCTAKPAVAGAQKAEIALRSLLPGSAWVNEKPLDKEVLHMPFDDSLAQDLSLVARDVSGLKHNSPKCSDNTCPSPQQAGRAGRSFYFDGVNDIVNAGSQITLTNSSFSVAFWMKRAATGRWDLAIGQGAAGAGTQLQMGYRLSNQFTCAFYGGSSYDLNTDADLDLGWHHWTCTYNAATNTRTLWRDGSQLKQDKPTSAFKGTGNFYIGAVSPGSYYFNGFLDDVRVFTREISETEVKGLYLGSQPLLVLPFEAPVATDGDQVRDTSAWDRAATLHTGDTQNKTELGQAGNYALSLDGQDDYVDAGSGINLANRSFTAAFWARRPATGQAKVMLDQGTSGNSTRLTLGFRSTDAFYCGFYGNDLETATDNKDTNWHHWACTYDAQTKLRTIYRDGTPVKQGVATADYIGSGTLYIGSYGGTSTYFRGSLDDVRLYGRALPAQEIKDLYNLGWRTTTLADNGMGTESQAWSLASTAAGYPQGLEGTYELAMRGTDAGGHTEAMSELSTLWQGEADNTKPRVTLCEQLISGATYRYVTVAEDFNLMEKGFITPCAISGRTYFQSPWYLTSADSDKLYGLRADCQMSQVTNPQATACDTLGGCNTVNVSDATTCAPILALQAASSGLHKTAAAAASDATPAVVITSGVITSTHASPSGMIPITGYVTGLPLVTGVAVNVGGVEGAATISDPAPTSPYTITWSYAWLPAAGALLDGASVEALATVTAPAPATATQAVQAAAAGQAHTLFLPLVFQSTPGQVAFSVHKTLILDVTPPAPVTLALAANGEPIEAGAVVRTAAPELRLAWNASQDGAGVAGYEVRWQATSAGGTGEKVNPIGPTGPYEDAYWAGEAQQVAVQLVILDQYGNRRAQDFGWVVVDAALTPDLVLLPANQATAAHQAWLETGCSYMGMDGRAARVSGAGTWPAQRLYASWDQNALRLAWTGAHWSADGDLFIYLDTGPGGTGQTFSPYPVPATASNILLPEGLAADRLVWVQDYANASLLTWDGSGWTGAIPLPAAQYRFDAGETDLYLPFALLGMSAGGKLSLMAIATEEPKPDDGLRVWATLPLANPTNSSRSNPRAGLTNLLASRGIAMPLLHYFAWADTGDGVCPNGSNEQRADVQIETSVTTDPVGATVSGLDGPLFWTGKPAGVLAAAFAAEGAGTPNAPGADLVSELLSPEHRPVPNGQQIAYTVRIANKAAEPLAGAYLVLDGLGPLHLVEDRVDLGDIPAGGEGIATFHGVADTSLSATGPALALAQVYAAGYPTNQPALDWLVAVHRVDRGAPQDLAFDLPASRVGQAGGVLSGHAFDESGVTQVTLEITGPRGNVLTLLCPVQEGQEGRWACSWDATSANGGTPPEDGAQITVRFQATDRYGQVSPWSEPRTITVDSLPPEVALKSGLLQRGRLRLSGLAIDPGGPATLTICVDEQCQDVKLGDGSSASENWSFSQVVGASDYVTHTVTIQATDALGNRRLQPQAFDVIVDNTGPALTATQLTDHLDLGATATVLQGTTADGAPSVQTSVLVESPSGDLIVHAVAGASQDWAFDLTGERPGTYHLTVEAQDLLGNKSEVGPFTVDVTCTNAALAVSDLIAEPTEGMSLTFTLKATLTNAGPAGLPVGIPVGFYDENGRITASSTTAALAAGGQQTLTAAWSAAAIGRYDIFVVPGDPDLGLALPVVFCSTPATARAVVDAGVAPEEQLPVYLPLIMSNASASLIPAELVSPVEQPQPVEPPAAMSEDGENWTPDKERDKEP